MIDINFVLLVLQPLLVFFVLLLLYPRDHRLKTEVHNQRSASLLSVCAPAQNSDTPAMIIASGVMEKI